MARAPKWPISAYSASQPVTASTTEPSATKAVQGSRRNRLTPYIGLTARRICGALRMAAAPSTPSTMNHSTITGPNSLPIVSVPRLWIRNSAIRITRVKGTTKGAKLLLPTLMPSSADSTEMAGVSMPSP